MDRFDLQLIELVGLGVAVLTVVVVYTLLELRDRRTVGKAEKDLDRKLKDWVNKYAELKGDYLEADAERVEWKRMYEEAREKVIQDNNQWIKDFDVKIAETDRLKQEIECKQAKIETYATDYMHLKVEYCQIKQELEALEALLKTSEENVALLQQARDERIRDADQEIIRLQAELSACDQAWRKCGKDRDELTLDKESLASAREAMGVEIERLQGELSACNQQNRELSVENDRLKQSADLWQQRCAERDEQARQREERFGNDEPKSSEAEVKRLKTELLCKCAENISLKNQLEDLEVQV